jgi:hypothetical protein
MINLVCRPDALGCILPGFGRHRRDDGADSQGLSALASIMATLTAACTDRLPQPLPAIPVFRESDAIVVLDGMQRVAVARALGFTHLPCLVVDLEEAI